MRLRPAAPLLALLQGSLLSLAATLPLLAAGRPPVRIAAALPAGFALDGELGEWSSPPALELGAADPGRPDLRAKVWLALTTAGFVLAADVTDDAVVLPSATLPLSRADHLELWLAFPEAVMPPISFFLRPTDEPIEVPTPEACAAHPEVEGERCRAWVEEQQAWRDALGRLFVRHYLVSSEGVVEDWWREVEEASRPDHLAMPWPACCAGSRSRVAPRRGGYVVEAFIPSAELPPTARDPLDVLALGLDLHDADAAGESGTLVTSSGGLRTPGGPHALEPAVMEVPLRYESVPPFVVSTFEDSATPEALFVFPAERVTRLFGFENPPYDYDAPSEPSPGVPALELPAEPLARWRDLSVYAVPSDFGIAGIDGRVAIVRAGARIGSYDFESSCDMDAPREVLTHEDGCLRVAFICPGTHNPWGIGMCGACEVDSVEVVALDAGGRMTKLHDEVVDCQGYDTELTRSPEGFAFRCGDDPGGPLSRPEPGEWEFRWSDMGSCPPEQEQPGQ